jgi:uncharacterized protein with HEPN domain
MQEYHLVSDSTMEALLDSLEEVVDRHPELPYEVEYHVRKSIILNYFWSNDAFWVRVAS